MNFSFSIHRYDRKTTESETIGPHYILKSEADSVKEELQKNDPNGIYTVQENND